MAETDRKKKILKKGKSGILRVIFGRTTINVLLIFVQVALYLDIFVFLSNHLPEIFSGTVILQVCFIVFILNHEDSVSIKLTWIVLFAIAPVYAAGMYLLITNDAGHRWLKKTSLTVTKLSDGILKQDNDAMKRLRHSSRRTANLAHYLRRTGDFPVFRHTSAKYYKLGDDMLPDLIKAIQGAKNFIFIEYFIIEEGEMWNRILDELVKKVNEGVEVRVMYDGMCEFSKLPHNYPKKLRALGIHVRIFDKIKPFVSTLYNFRDHRKFFIVDGTVGFTGGVNLADEYINAVTKFGHWKDTGIRLVGEAVRSMTLMMLSDWEIADATEKVEKSYTFNRKNIYSQEKADEIITEFKKYTDYPVIKTEYSDGYIMPFGDNPLDEYRVGETVYIDILNRAERYVYIMTPYLIIDEDMKSALMSAAAKGVHVRLITPHIPDKKLVFALTRSYYKDLTLAGVDIYEYTPGFVHSKVFLSDDKRAVVGSINLDYRSLYHHFEDAVFIEDNPVIRDIKQDFMETFHKCHHVTMDDIKHQNVVEKFTGQILSIISYLL